MSLVVTLGSPIRGTPWAAVLLMGPLVRALHPGSPMLRQLAAAPVAAGVRRLAFASTLDAIVPVDRAVPPDRRPALIGVDGAGHCGMLRDLAVIARIVAATSERRRSSAPASDGVDHLGVVTAGNVSPRPHAA